MSPASDDDTRLRALEALTATLQERIAASDKALLLQAPEILRRLDDLNHAHAAAQEVQATYVPRELHERTQLDNDKRLRALEAWKEGLEGGAKTATLIARAAWAVVAGAGGAATLFIWQALTGSKPL